MITVEGGNEFFSERMRARIATASRRKDQLRRETRAKQRLYRRFPMSLEFSFQHTPISAGNAMEVGSQYIWYSEWTRKDLLAVLILPVY